MSNEHSYLPTLSEMQKIDVRLQQAEKELEAIPTQLATGGAEYLTLKGASDQKQAAHNAMQKEHLALEEAVKTTQIEIDLREKRLSSLKTQKEYQATAKEIAQMKQENKQREARILQLLEGEETLQKESTQLISELADKEGIYRQLEGELKQRQAALEQEVVALREQKPKLLESLPPEILKKYELVKRRYVNPLAPVQRGICYGCNMNIPPQFYNEMRKHKDLRNCPNCHRLIYVEE